MKTLELLDMDRRGDENFDALTEVEKNLYVLHLFVTLDEMEGITHFFSYHLDYLPRLLAFLAVVEAPNWRAVHELAEFLKVKAGSLDPDSLENFLCNESSEDSAMINMWQHEYYSNVQEMWARVEEYLREQFRIQIV